MCRSLTLVVVAMLASACGSNDPGATVDAGPPDAPDGTGCTTLTPRTQPVETFVGPTGLQTKLTQLIDSANTSLDVQMYLFTVQGLEQRIVAAKQRGVAVRLILDPDEAGNTSVQGPFTSAGVTWKNAPAVYPYSHAKYMVIDHAAAVIMSMNFNVDAMVNERNYGLIDKDPEDVADVQAIFEYDWALANGQQPAAPNLTCTRLVVSPVNSLLRVNEMIAHATRTLDVETLYITDGALRNSIGSAAMRGVAVRVILESPQDQPVNANNATYFANVGVPVKYATTQFYNHAKLIIADGAAFVGSQNLSPTSLGQNREVGAVAFEASAVPLIQQQFDTDWAATTPAP